MHAGVMDPCTIREDMSRGWVRMVMEGSWVGPGQV